MKSKRRCFNCGKLFEIEEPSFYWDVKDKYICSHCKQEFVMDSDFLMYPLIREDDKKRKDKWYRFCKDI